MDGGQEPVAGGPEWMMEGVVGVVLVVLAMVALLLFILLCKLCSELGGGGFTGRVSCMMYVAGTHNP